MKLTNLSISIIAGLIIATIVAMSSNVLSNIEDSFMLSIVVWLILFLISFFTFLILTQRFIYNQLQKILLQIQTYRAIKIDANSSLLKNNLLEELNIALLNWFEERKNEMEGLHKLETYRREFLGNVSHELKTPIFNIQGYILTLLGGGLEDPNINKKYLERAEKSVDRMIGIVEDLEAISQLETGELLLKEEPFDILTTLEDVFETLEIKATKKGIMLSIEYNFMETISVYADQYRIRQVLSNLIENSIKYGKEYGETKVHLYNLENMLRIEIADNGIGIEKEHLPRLFERFYRVDKSRSRGQGGTGLGLAIVKHIIEAHNQTINVTSLINEGSVFSFTLKKAGS